MRVVNRIKQGHSLRLSRSGGGEADAVEAHVVATGADHEVDDLAAKSGAAQRNLQAVLVAEACGHSSRIGPVELLADVDPGGVQSLGRDAGGRCGVVGVVGLAGGAVLIDGVSDRLDRLVALFSRFEYGVVEHADGKAREHAVVGDAARCCAFDGQHGRFFVLRGLRNQGGYRRIVLNLLRADGEQPCGEGQDGRDRRQRRRERHGSDADPRTQCVCHHVLLCVLLDGARRSEFPVMLLGRIRALVGSRQVLIEELQH